MWVIRSVFCEQKYDEYGPTERAERKDAVFMVQLIASGVTSNPPSSRKNAFLGVSQKMLLVYMYGEPTEAWSTMKNGALM